MRAKKRVLFPLTLHGRGHVHVRDGGDGVEAGDGGRRGPRPRPASPSTSSPGPSALVPLPRLLLYPPRLGVAPHVGPAVRRGDVQDGDALEIEVRKRKRIC